MIGDDVLKEFCTFDAGVIPLFNQAPAFITRKALDARDQLLHRLKQSSFWDLCSPLIMDRKKRLPLPEELLSRANLGVLWASVGNSIPAVFWILLLLLEHQEAWDSCRAQVKSVIAKRSTSTAMTTTTTELGGDGARTAAAFTFDELDELTLLQSAFTEALRLYTGTFTARRVRESFTLETSKGTFLMEEGCKLMPFWGILNTDLFIFENPEEFQYDRFIDPTKVYTYQSGKKLTHSPPVVSFGGGSHLCPGCKFISYEARLFLAMLMESFKMQLLLEGEQRPGTNPAMQGIGISHPNKDLKVQIRARNND